MAVSSYSNIITEGSEAIKSFLSIQIQVTLSDTGKELCEWSHVHCATFPRDLKITKGNLNGRPSKMWEARETAENPKNNRTQVPGVVPRPLCSHPGSLVLGKDHWTGCLQTPGHSALHLLVTPSLSLCGTHCGVSRAMPSLTIKQCFSHYPILQTCTEINEAISSWSQLAREAGWFLNTVLLLLSSMLP